MVLNAFISSFLIAASVEETAKYLLLWRVSERRGFMNPTACVVYAVSAALGEYKFYLSNES
jgi:RsiW-degrading membrane proteinase PrsW (M82 family)